MSGTVSSDDDVVTVVARGDAVAPRFKPEEIEALLGQRFQYPWVGAGRPDAATTVISPSYVPMKVERGRIPLPDLSHVVNGPSLRAAAWALQDLYGKTGYPALASNEWLAREVSKRLKGRGVPPEHQKIKGVTWKTISRLQLPRHRRKRTTATKLDRN
jgi:hypothetical protein